ncbi:MFS transporter [Fibrobacterota bacterium]
MSEKKVITQLSVMMFLQFFLWGAWFVTLGQCLGTNGLADFIGGAYGTAPIAAIIAPLFLGIIADRFFASQKVMGVLLLIGGVLMCIVPSVAATGNGKLMVWLFTGHMLCYMPTLALGNNIVFANVSDQNMFPKIRVWGTIGWIVAGLIIGFLGWSAKFNIFWLAGICSLSLGLYCFVLPDTPAPAKGKPVDYRALLMFDAFSLMKKPAFLVFIICSTLICIPLAYYYAFTSNYLSNSGFLAPASTMSIGQMSEIIFMVLMPFFLRRIGVKYMILVGMLAWVTRYVLFAVGAPSQVTWMLFLGILLHGICYDFFFVTGFMYTDRVSSKDIKSQAQSMLVFFTQGIGMYFGYKVAFGKFFGTVSEDYQALDSAIKAVRPEESLSFLQSLGRMFSVEKLSVDPTIISNAMSSWKAFWFLPAIMASVIAVVFFLGFWDKDKETD